ncbi:MAG: L-2-amino-thiazoline-4-carboxylic acid hydrolase [Oscillospiraceae bacterium]|nr:L-2-amino-thiazoline-4-carboxylic acid hydrolase [Oscillospiraceae bacterium]
MTHNFCDSDIYCYGNLPGIKFERTQTLGTGGSCCDFSFTIERGN